MINDYDGGSFKDPQGYVFYKNGKVFREINHIGMSNFLECDKQNIYKKSIARKFLINHRVVKNNKKNIIIEHEKIPFISYPSEWSFEQLKKAALHHIAFHKFLINNEFTLSDANFFNIQFIGNKPIFIDTLSIIPFSKIDYWYGYRQFCECFLYPLLIASSKQLRINLILKGYLNGIPLQDAYKLLSFKEKFSLFGLLHLVIPYQFEKKKNLKKSHSSEPRKKKITKKSQLLILNQIEKFISKLKGPNITQSTWSNYDKENFYSTIDIREKKRIIKKVINKIKPSLAIDIGCNTGAYSRVAIHSGCKYIIGYDFDHNVIDRASKEINNKLFLPLFLDVTNPTVNSGWLESERKGLIERSKEINFLMALAISHHIIIGKNIPIESFCRWISRLAPYGIVEFVPKDDPAIIQLLKFREDIFHDYSKTNFEINLSKYSKIIKSHTLPNSNRVLYEFKTK